MATQPVARRIEELEARRRTLMARLAAQEMAVGGAAGTTAAGTLLASELQTSADGNPHAQMLRDGDPVSAAAHGRCAARRSCGCRGVARWRKPEENG
ncbi:hypothetical protein [Rhizobium nepotum]|uniref:hypothetical protein n=1 Tax=Rhizobium nepotum TaxID=1035271 RepID=UPI003CF652D7